MSAYTPEEPGLRCDEDTDEAFVDDVRDPWDEPIAAHYDDGANFGGEG